jgi:hypothetical protein
MNDQDRRPSHPKKKLVFPALAQFPPAVFDVDSVPEDSTSLRLVEKAVKFSRLSQLKLLTKLWCFGINDERLRTIAQCVALKQLFLEDVRLADLSPLAQLQGLDSLSVAIAPKAASLDQLANLGWLEGLRIEHFKAVTSLDPLKRLSKLQCLAVAGSMWTRMTVDSLAPLATLKELRFLHLTNLKARDESLEPLRQLTLLEELECANFYPMEQFARLRAALPHVRCMWFSPVVSARHMACKKCGLMKMVMLSGKGTRTLCRDCDEARIRKHEDAFNEIAMRSIE